MRSSWSGCMNVDEHEINLHYLKDLVLGLIFVLDLTFTAICLEHKIKHNLKS